MNKKKFSNLGDLNIPLGKENKDLIILPINMEPKKQKILGLIKKILSKIIKILSKKD